jgi:hypothetical protein
MQVSPRCATKAAVALQRGTRAEATTSTGSFKRKYVALERVLAPMCAALLLAGAPERRADALPPHPIGAHLAFAAGVVASVRIASEDVPLLSPFTDDR